MEGGGHWSSENSPPARFGPGLSSPTTGCMIAGAAGRGSLRPMCLPPPRSPVVQREVRGYRLRLPVGSRCAQLIRLGVGGRERRPLKSLSLQRLPLPVERNFPFPLRAPPGEGVARAGLGEGGGRTAETICVSSASDGEQGGELGAGGGGFIIGARPRQGVGRT